MILAEPCRVCIWDLHLHVWFVKHPEIKNPLTTYHKRVLWFLWEYYVRQPDQATRSDENSNFSIYIIHYFSVRVKFSRSVIFSFDLIYHFSYQYFFVARIRWPIILGVFGYPEIVADATWPAKLWPGKDSIRLWPLPMVDPWVERRKVTLYLRVGEGGRMIMSRHGWMLAKHLG